MVEAYPDVEFIGEIDENDKADFLGRATALLFPIDWPEPFGLVMIEAMACGTPVIAYRRGSVPEITGAVLDPIFALRRRVRIAPGATARVDFWTMVASSRAGVLDLIDKHHDVAAFERAAALAWTQSQVQLHHLGIDRSEAGQYQRLAGHVVYAAPTLRPPSETIRDGSGGQPCLWPLGISGDLPIIAGSAPPSSAVIHRCHENREKQVLPRDLSGLDLLVIQIDGIHMDDDLIRDDHPRGCSQRGAVSVVQPHSFGGIGDVLSRPRQPVAGQSRAGCKYLRIEWYPAKMGKDS